MYYIGFDIGTSSLKVTVIDQQKHILTEDSYAYHYDEDEEGYREIDPQRWITAAQHAILELSKQGYLENARVFGVTGQMHTTVMLDSDGLPVRPAIMWNDSRTASLVNELREEIKDIEELRYIRRILSTGSPFMNLLWVKTMEPALFQSIRKVMTAYDYLVYHLTGKESCDYCGASTSAMYDILTKQWSSYMLDRLGINETYFGTLHASCDIVGTVKKELLHGNTTEDILVIAGTGDNPATAMAMGLLHQKEPVISLGTSGVVIVAKQDGRFDGNGKNVLFQARRKEIINVVQGVVQAAGGAHRWWIENILETQNMASDQQAISLQDLGRNTVLFYPHLSGDKTIYSNPSLRGAFLGLSTSTKRKDMTQAVMEGVGFGLRDVLAHMMLPAWPSKIRVNGGGSTSELWMQMLADILGADIEVAEAPATPAYGVCLLAMWAVNDMSEAREPQRYRVYQPDHCAVARYHQQFQTYRRICQTLGNL